MTKVTVYHNPRCSKSRSAITHLNENDIKHEVIEYLKTPPSKALLIEILAKLNIPAEQLVRKGEEEFKQHFRGKNLSEDEWIEAMVQFPKLIERPIIVKNGKAVIARPTEKIDSLI